MRRCVQLPVTDARFLANVRRLACAQQYILAVYYLVTQMHRGLAPEDAILNWRSSYSPLLLGVIVGLAFGSVNLLVTSLNPLADDTPGALLLFYGPMFFVWAAASFRAAQRSGQVLSGVRTGAIVAFGTFVAYDLLIFLRINLFLDQLSGRADWQYMMTRFRASGLDSLRLFVNVDYVKGIPLKLAVSCAIGLMMGAAGGILGRLRNRHPIATA